MKERSIEQYFTRRIQTIGGLAMKFTSPGLAGVPDRLVLIKGRAVFVELKSPTGRVTRRQALMHRRLQGLGFPVEVVRSTADADRLVQALLLEEVTHGVSSLPVPEGGGTVDL